MPSRRSRNGGWNKLLAPVTSTTVWRSIPSSGIPYCVQHRATGAVARRLISSVALRSPSRP